MSTARERRLPGDTIAAIDGDRAAKRKEPRGKGRIRLTKDLPRPVIRKLGAERINGGRELQIPSGRAVDPRDLLEHLERRDRVGFEPAKCPRTPHPIKSASAHRVRNGVGQAAFPFGIGGVRSDDRFDPADGIKQ